ncbi:MAG: hypothetical protein HC892_21095, partial [Saprospiraceae bacterium]|nr:hypothetical protein [Saprospiraceae bacterium]
RILCCSPKIGHINKVSLREPLLDNPFKRAWKIKKDDVKICKDCEFRYICSDCRVFTEDPEDINSKPLKCGYNPYTLEWTDWKSTPEKQLQIQYYKSIYNA